MIKILLNLSFFIIYSLSFSNNDISLFIKKPAFITKNNVYIIKTIINKSDINGFSKYEIHLPDFVKIKAVKTSGANFIQKGNIAKFIWLILPNENEVEIKYQIELLPEYKNTHLKLKSRFFFLNNNSKTKFINFNTEIKVLKKIKIIPFNTEYTHYSIQFGAFSKKLNPKLKHKLFNSLNMTIIKEGKYYKYRYGNFKTKDEAIYFLKQQNITQNVYLIPANNKN